MHEFSIVNNTIILHFANIETDINFDFRNVSESSSALRIISFSAFGAGNIDLVLQRYVVNKNIAIIRRAK